MFHHAQLVPLRRLLQISRFSSNHNIRWRLLNLSNYNFMINPNTSKTPSIHEKDLSFNIVHAMIPISRSSSEFNMLTQASFFFFFKVDVFLVCPLQIIKLWISFIFLFKKYPALIKFSTLLSTIIFKNI